MPEKDNLQDFNDAYRQSVEKWWPFWQVAKTDMKFKLGNPWSEADKTRLKKQERDAHVFNRCRRMVNLISGWERRNRLSIKLDPIEGADRKTVDQLSGATQFAWQKGNAYAIISNAFEKGPVTCGLNLVEVYLDFLNDPVAGDLAFMRLPYNRFLLDPYFTDPGLSDCRYALTRDWMSRDQVGMMLPGISQKRIEGIQPQGKDQKYPDAPASKDFKGKNLLKVDRFFRRTLKQGYVLFHPESGQQWDFDGKKSDLDAFLSSAHPMMQRNWGELVRPMEVKKASVQLSLFIEDKEWYDGEEPNGLDDYPFTAFMGYFEPESDDWRNRLCGIIRDMRDPQTESNRRRLKFIDVLDNFLDAVVAKKGALVNPKAAYQRGPMVLWMTDDTDEKKYEINRDVAILRGGGAVPGLVEAIQMFDKDLEEIPGGSETLLGLPSKDDPQEAWVMGKLRMQAGLTIFEPLMDNLRSSIKSLGQKSVDLLQANYPSWKIARMINQQPSQLFYDRGFIKYDVLPVQGLLTASQKQMKYAQLMSLANMPQFQGKIPLSMLLEASDLELSSDWIAQLKQKEQMQDKLMMLGLQEKFQGARTQQAAMAAKAEMQRAQAQKALSEAAKNIAALQQIPEDRLHKLIELALELDRQGGFGLEPMNQVTAAPSLPITKR